MLHLKGGLSMGSFGVVQGLSVTELQTPGYIEFGQSPTHTNSGDKNAGSIGSTVERHITRRPKEGGGGTAM